MKQQTVNEFKDGLNLDLHPLVTPKTVLTDNINGTFITYNGNEFCLQNDRGNKKITSLSPGYTPIGIKEHNGILYIVSVNGNGTEIGTFPSPNYPESSLNYDYDVENTYDLNLEKYQPLHVLEDRTPLTGVDLGYTIKTPVTIEIQDSYDGSINLILIADGCKPRIINSGFSVLPDNKYKFVNRKQEVATNIYDDINKESELIRTSDVLTNVDLLGVQAGGQFKGGNYTFYIKFGDGDFNQTDVVAESGIVSIFNGNDGLPSTISGTLLDERTDKMVNLRIIGLNPVYSKIYIYYSREYSDTQGYRMTEYGMLNEPINMEKTGTNASGMSYQDIWLTGFEETVPIEPEFLNVDYHTIDWARAEAQHSNMLFLGNVGNKETFELYHSLEDFTLNPENVTYNIGQGLMYQSGGDSFSAKNYYSTMNIYYSLGYWPNEWYRFGIVYILEDGSTTPVFNMRGNVNNNNKGVFRTPNLDVLGTNNPIYFKFELHNTNRLNSKVKGWFVVRQKRIPITVCQALSIGTDKRCYLPVIPYNNKWYIESFLSLDRSQEIGELWRHEPGSAAIHQVTGQPHILRPFLEKFDGSKPFEMKDNPIYLALPFSYGQTTAEGASTIDNESTQNWYDSNIQSVLQNAGYNSSSDVLVEQEGIRYNWENNTDTHSLKVWKLLGTTDINSENVEGTFIFYVTADEEEIEELNPSETYYGNNSSVYLMDLSDLDEYNLQTLINASDKFIYRFIEEDYNEINQNALLSLDPCVNSLVGSMLDGSKFSLSKEYNIDCTRDDMVFSYNTIGSKISNNSFDSKLVFVGEKTKSKVMDDKSIFSSLAGTGTSAGDFEYTKHPFGVKTDAQRKKWSTRYIRRYKKDNRVDDKYGTSDYYGYNSTHNVNLVRGIFTPYIGSGSNVELGLYSIKLNSIGDSNARLVREQDDSEYYAVTERIPVSTNNVIAYRGDCYICKVGMRILRNFIDNTAPVTNTIVDPLGWERWVRQRSLYGGDDTDSENGGKDSDSYAAIVDYSEVNLSDLNAVDLGYWVTFPCLSSYNLGLRSLDTFHTDEMALLGAPRSFYPLSGASGANKIGDSYLLNDGLSATVGRKRYNIMPDVPYSKSEFANRIMFSNVHITDAFTNGYRTFQGLSYKDYDKQYGAITKLIPLGQNIFIVMEHGLGLVPINPKALMQTTTGEAIHIYGYGVLPDEMTIISQDYGSKYEHSVIRTPIGIYGMDVDAKKIWRFSDKQGFETISDMKIETYLKDYLKNVPVEVGIKDVRAHYNGDKGDVMFTFYDEDDSIQNVGNVDYFNIGRKHVTVVVNETKIVRCDTNLDNSEISFTNSDNIECSYSDKTLEIKGLEEGVGEININDVLLTVDVVPKTNISVDDISYIEVVDYPDESWYIPSTSQDKSIYFNVRQIDTLYGMRFSLPAFLKCPNGRPITPNSNAAAYSIDQIVSVESENTAIIDLPSGNHVASTTLYEECDNYTLPTIVHVSEKRFKGTGSVGIRIYNKDKTEYDTCIVNVLSTNPEGFGMSQFEQKNLVWPFNIYVEKNSYFDVWTHHHLRNTQIVTIDDPTAIQEVQNGYILEDGVKTTGTNIKLNYSSRQFKSGNKSGTYHISFTCPKTQYYDYSGTFTVTVHVI